MMALTHTCYTLIMAALAEELLEALSQALATTEMVPSGTVTHADTFVTRGLGEVIHPQEASVQLGAEAILARMVIITWDSGVTGVVETEL